MIGEFTQSTPEGLREGSFYLLKPETKKRAVSLGSYHLAEYLREENGMRVFRDDDDTIHLLPDHEINARVVEEKKS